MQPIDAVTLKHLSAEWHQMLCGARVSKIQHLASHDYLFVMWGGGLDGAPSRGDNHGLYFNLDPMHPVVSLINPKEKDNWVLPEFDKPTGTCLLLRKHLNNALLTKVETLAGERVINFTFENFNELGNKVQLLLSVEIMGKHTNMLLVDCLEDSILGVAHGVSSKMSSYRELMPGVPYAPPPLPPDKTFLSQLTQSQFVERFKSVEQKHWLKTVQQNFYGWGGDLLKHSVGMPDQLESLYDTLFQLEAGQSLAPAVSSDLESYRLLSFSDDEQDWDSKESVDELLRDYYGEQLKRTRLLRKQKLLIQAIDKQLEKHQEQVTQLSSSDEEDTAQDKHYGDLILTAVSSGNLPDTPTEEIITLSDYLTGQDVEITIDPALGWQENAQRYYKRVKKSNARLAQAEERMSLLLGQADYFYQLKMQVEHAEDLSTLLLLEEEMRDAGILRQKKTKGKQASKKSSDKQLTGVSQYVSSDGFTILVGKSGVGNHEVVRQGRSHDRWLHVAEGAGSHVLIKTDKQDVPDQTMLEACNLAVHFSKSRGSLNVPVLYTDLKYVKTIPGSYPGHVNYKNEESVFISVEEDIIGKFL